MLFQRIPSKTNNVTLIRGTGQMNSSISTKAILYDTDSSVMSYCTSGHSLNVVLYIVLWIFESRLGDNTNITVLNKALCSENNVTL